MIGIIDYEAGNLRSVEKAFAFLGYDAFVSNDIDKLSSADAIVLPGVGAFAEAMSKLKNMGMDNFISEVVQQGNPFLGICLGFQLLFECSYEGGVNNGLGVLKGEVRRIPDNLNLKVPHMGWNSLDIKRDNLLMKGLPENPYVYFVHSYYADASNKEDVIASTSYGMEIHVAVQKDNVFATQFHPEKSGKIGLKMLDNFAKYVIDRKEKSNEDISSNRY